MANTVEHYYSASWIDISDYVESLDDPERSMTNLDGTVKSESTNLIVAVTIRDSASYPDDFDFSVGELIRFKVGSNIVFSGMIESSKYNNTDMNFSVKVKNNILKLKDYKVDHDTLNTQIATGTNWWEYTAVDGVNAQPVAGILWILKSIFVVAGLTLDTSTIDDEVIFNQTAWSSVDITYKDLMTYLNVLWCLNQTVAISYTVLDLTTEDYNKNKIDCFEYVSNVISELDLGIVQTTDTEFKLLLQEGAHTVADDDNFDYDEEKIGGEIDVDTMGVVNQVNSGGVVSYTSLTPVEIQVLSSGKGQQINNMMNLVIIATNAKDIVNYYEGAYSSQICVPAAVVTKIIEVAGVKWLNTAYRAVKSKVNSYSKADILTNYLSTNKIITKHKVDMQWSNSGIEQVTY